MAAQASLAYMLKLKETKGPAMSLPDLDSPSCVPSSNNEECVSCEDSTVRCSGKLQGLLLRQQLLPGLGAQIEDMQVTKQHLLPASTSSWKTNPTTQNQAIP
jgi:hypothetical protein